MIIIFFKKRFPSQQPVFTFSWPFKSFQFKSLSTMNFTFVQKLHNKIQFIVVVGYIHHYKYVKDFQTSLINLLSSGWDYYCTDCDCLEPTTGTTTGATPAACEDIWKAKKCKKMEKKGRCKKPKVETNCKKTCGACQIPR